MLNQIKEDVLFKLNEVCKNLRVTNTPEELSNLFFRKGEPNLYWIISSEIGFVPTITYGDKRIVPARKSNFFARLLGLSHNGLRSETDVVIWLDNGYTFIITEVIEFYKNSTNIRKIYYK